MEGDDDDPEVKMEPLNVKAEDEGDVEEEY